MLQNNIIMSAAFLAISLFADFKTIFSLEKKEKAVYYSVVSIAFLIILVFSFNIEIPSPSEIVTKFIEFFTKK